MKVQEIEIGRVTPYERNPRKNEAAVAKVAASLREFGFQQPIVVDRDYVVIAGHTRLAAAKALGMVKVPVVVAANLSPEQAKAYRLADNRTGAEAEWDPDLLKLELGDLAETEFDLDLTGFDEDELNAALAADETYTPALTPMASKVEVTRKDVERAEQKLAGQFSEAAAQTVVRIECPFCAETFGVDPDKLRP